ncbi:MAG: DNA polymerase III subunit alpha [Saprospiraceae bacterium]|nr:DNA polymerase III subunit alpha [Saprospiraceae bacterium]
MYINCHSYFSLRYGTFAPEELPSIAKSFGVDALVFSDINNTSAAFQFVRACRAEGIKPILGIEFRQDNEFLYLGIARNDEGWRELCSLLTVSSISGEPLPKEAPELQHCYIIYRKLPKGVELLRDYEYAGIRPEEVNHLYSSYLKNYPDKLVIFSPVTFADQDGFKAHKLLRCIDLNIVIGKLDAKDCAKSSEVFFPKGHFENVFQQYPHIIANTQHILDNCHTDMEATKFHNRRTFTGDPDDDFKLLTKLAVSGCKRRFGEKHKKAMERTLRELKVIQQMGFCAYFLITWDIVRYAHSVGYFHVGRGSGANSIVAYNLNITDVDPLELDLYFERFINPHRSSPPDFDIDFSWNNRDDVTDYIFKRYGKEHTALLATYNTFKGKSIIRELGKVLGLPKADIDTIVDEPMAVDKHHPFARHIFKYGKMIEKFPNYLSIHAGGILISERPLNYHTALQLMPKGFPIVHFDMYGAEDLEYHKYDVLSQRGLGHIKDAVDLVKQNQGKAIDVHNVALIKEDPNVKAQLKSGHCIGCFYIESPAMRGLLHKLRCDNYVHLVAASSIIRPGVAQSGMMREYIQRFHKPDSYTYLHPVFEEHLGETYGVMVYQEDVMKIVHHFSGLDLDESDVLRRIMTGKKKSSDTFYRLQEKYFRNCKERGYPDELSKEVWRQIESFSGYSFCKAHSASFAAESFQSLYLKTYFPLEFMTAVINNFGGFYSTEQYVHEARMCGAKIEAPCVNNSTYLTNIYGTTIYIGLIHLANLEQKLAHAIVEERQIHGDYRSLKDFTHRINISKEQLEFLIRIGAFRWTGLNKYELMWEKNAVHNPLIKHVYAGEMLFDTEPENYTLPILAETEHEQAFDEIELLGFPLCNPFDLLQTKFRGDIKATQMKDYLGQTVRMVGYYVCRKWVTTSKGDLMNFGTMTDVDGHFFDTVHFPPSLKAYAFQGKGCYIVLGKVVDDFGFASLEVSKMEKLPWVKDGRY